MTSQQLGMTVAVHSHDHTDRAIVVGAGIAGLAVAARLAHAGKSVAVFEAASEPGGKIRTLPSCAGPVDTGPTVLTMRPVFDQLFKDLGARLEDYVTLHRHHMIARHFWRDGSQLDLFDDPDANRNAIHAFAGATAAKQFSRFDARARTLFETFDAPMMQASHPSFAKLAAHVAMRFWLLPKLAPHITLDRLLRQSFDDPRLIQLFGRYATYVGGSPFQSPGLLALIWQAETAGVWSVDGGMHRLAQAIESLARAQGVVFEYDTPVDQIIVENGRATGVKLRDGRSISANTIVFNGDPLALADGHLGEACSAIASQTRTSPRSLSAEVWAFAAKPAGPELAYHNVFFRKDAKAEFDALASGTLVPDPTIYVCAMDHGGPGPVPEMERFETIANAPPLTASVAQEEFSRCQTRTFHTLEHFGLTFDQRPGPEALTTPATFNRLFPASAGSLYGQSPHGLTAALQRPQAQTRIKGLFLAGGGAHPGAGIPMATLSARHAAETILKDQTSTFTSPRTVMRGGMSTGSATAAGARSASSGS